jgi:hypothetical protein
MTKERENEIFEILDYFFGNSLSIEEKESPPGSIDITEEEWMELDLF